MKRICRVVNGATVWEPPFTEAENAAHREQMQEMFRTGETPCLVTDATFLAGHCNGNQFEGAEDVGDVLKREAEEAGVSVKGKVYKSSLARFPADPAAWISGRGDAKRVFEENLAPLGWNADGAIKGKAQERREEPPKPPRLAADIVNNFVEKEMETNPEAARDLEGLKERIVSEHGRRD